MTSIREMVGPLRELKNLNEFQVKIKERLEQQLPPLYAGIKTGNIFKTLYTIQKELNDLKPLCRLSTISNLGKRR